MHQPVAFVVILSLTLAAAAHAAPGQQSAQSSQRIPARQVEAVQRIDLDSARLNLRASSAPPLDTIRPSSAQSSALREPGAVAEGRRGPALRRQRMEARQAPLDDFPYQAQDFADNERVFRGKAVHNPDNPESTWQQFAYDIGAMQQQEGGSWRDTKPTIDWKAPKNSDYYVYGKPVYAVSPGVIVHCWRNAPENPRPYSGELDNAYPGMPLAEQTWLHEDTRAGKVHGSGNFIMVREANGNHVHYAHGQPGSIPATLCPHNDTLLSPASWETDSLVPAGQQVSVERGDFLFLTGNAGTSSAPHLHIDRTQPDKATSVQLRFRNGLANPLDPSTLKLNNAEWASFAGEQIPAGPVLVWPPRRPGGHWSWHGMTPAMWSDYFRHMADSGYQMSWIDGYSVAGRPFFNTIWEPAKAPWLGHALLSGAEYQAVFSSAVEDGYALVHVDSVLSGGQPRYNAIFVKGESMDFAARHGQGNAAFNATFQDLTGQGYSAVNASVISVGGQLQYTTLYRKQKTGGWVLLPGIHKKDYQRVYGENAQLKRYPRYINAFKHGNQVYYSVVFAERPKGPRLDRHGLSAADYQAQFNSAAMPIRAVSGVDGAASRHEYIAIWRKTK